MESGEAMEERDEEEGDEDNEEMQVVEQVAAFDHVVVLSLIHI